MRTRKINKKNGGFSLVEVIVGMMILSIIIVSVLAMFTQSSKSNFKSKLVQGAETLLVNLVEYVETGRAEVSVDGVYYPLSVDFSKSFTQMPLKNYEGEDADATTVEYTFKNVGSGFNSYTVKVSKDVDPSDYSGSELNGYEVINLGDSTNCSMLFDMVADADVFDRDALSVFRGLHQDYLAKLNESRDPDKMIKIPEYDGVNTYNFSKFNPKSTDPNQSLTETFTGGERTKVARKIFINVETKNDNKYVIVNAGFRYVLDSDVAIEEDANRTKDYVVFTSVPFNSNNQSGTSYLENLYILYKPTDFTGVKNSLELEAFNYDIIYEGDGINLLGAKVGSRGHVNFFIAYQENTLTSVDDAAGLKLSDRVNKDKTVNIKFDSTEAASVNIDVYCSAKVSQPSGGAQFSNLYNHKLIATQKSKRMVSYKIEIFDKDGKKIVEQKTSCMVNKGGQ